MQIKKSDSLDKILNIPINKDVLLDYVTLTMLQQYLIVTKPESGAIELFYLISKKFKQTELARLLEYKLWKNEAIGIESKKQSQILPMLYSWMTVYEEKLISPGHVYNNCFVLIQQFVRTKVLAYFQRIVLIDEIYDDLKNIIIYKRFWEDNKNIILEAESLQLNEAHDMNNLIALLKLLQLIIFKACLSTQAGQSNHYENNLVKIARLCFKYQNFVCRSLLYLLNADQFLKQHQKELTQLILLFSQVCMHDDYTLRLLKMVLKKTKKSIRLAFIKEYQQLAEMLEVKNKLDIIEDLQTMVEFRELIIKKLETNSLDLSAHQNQYNQIHIASGTSQCIYFQIQIINTLLCIEYYLDGDISFSLAFVGNAKEQSNRQYLSEIKKGSKNILILIRDCGLHCLKFDNSYSWLKSKTIKYTINVYSPIYTCK